VLVNVKARKLNPSDLILHTSVFKTAAPSNGLVFEPRASASGFVERINTFEETAC
jgi:hypothetical protein